MRKILPTGLILAALTLTIGCGGGTGQESMSSREREAIFSQHMTAQATLTAHYIAAALEAGHTPERINDTLAHIANQTVIAEFWITNEKGKVVFTNFPEVDFTFPTDPNAGTQAAPFAKLLTGAETAVAQDVTPRELDKKPYKYVGVAGVDRKRIVQVGVQGAALEPGP